MGVCEETDTLWLGKLHPKNLETIKKAPRTKAKRYEE